MSTNEVYGDTPNHLPLIEDETRFEIAEDHSWKEYGIDETMSIDNTLHSLFGASKAAADLLVQEYGRYFDMRTCCLRGGCLTGADHAGAELHGFLAYLMRCTATGIHYRVFGHKGKQVRDYLDARDLGEAIWRAAHGPSRGEAYNMGGGRYSNCSMAEAITMCEEITGHELSHNYIEEARIGDHIWWISDIRKFSDAHNGWEPKYSVQSILESIYDVGRHNWNQ